MDACSTIRHLVYLHLDGALDGAAARRVHEHLNGCAPCREVFVAERWIRSGSPPAPNGVGSDSFPILLRVSEEPRRWLFAITLGFVAGFVGLMTAIAYVFEFHPPAPASELVRVAVGEHQHYLRSPDELPIRTSDTAAITAQLEPHLSFRLGLSPTADPDVTLVGGAMLSTNYTEAALLVYRINDTPVSLILTTHQEVVTAVREIITFKNILFHAGQWGDHHTLQWSDRRFSYVLVSDDRAAVHQACVICHSSPQGLKTIAGFFQGI